MNTRRVISAIAFAGATIIAWLLLRQATLRSAQVTAVVGREMESQRPYAGVAWVYRAGVRPISLILDLVASNGASGSLTADGEQVSGEIPLAATFSGPYTLTATATYRLLGSARTKTQTFEGFI